MNEWTDRLTGKERWTSPDRKTHVEREEGRQGHRHMDKTSRQTNTQKDRHSKTDTIRQRN